MLPVYFRPRLLRYSAHLAEVRPAALVHDDEHELGVEIVEGRLRAAAAH